MPEVPRISPASATPTRRFPRRSARRPWPSTTAPSTAEAAQAAGPVQTHPAPAAEGIPRDTELTIAARRTIAQDRALAGVNVGVSVRQNVATLWGSIPSPALAQRAVAAVQRVPGVRSVRNQLALVPREDDG